MLQSQPAPSPVLPAALYFFSSRQLGHMDTGGLNNYMAAISRDGRWVAAGTFTSDVKVGGRLQRGRLFSGCLRDARGLMWNE